MTTVTQFKTKIMNYNLIQTPAKELDEETPQEAATNVQSSRREIFLQKTEAMDVAESVYLKALDQARPDFENELEVASGNHGVETDEIVRSFYNQPFDDQPSSSMPPIAWEKSYSPEKLAEFDDKKAAVNLKYRLAISDAQNKYEQARKEAKAEFDRQYQAIWDEFDRVAGTPTAKVQPSSPRLSVSRQPNQPTQQADDRYGYQAA